MNLYTSSTKTIDNKPYKNAQHFKNTFTKFQILLDIFLPFFTIITSTYHLILYVPNFPLYTCILNSFKFEHLCFLQIKLLVQSLVQSMHYKLILCVLRTIQLSKAPLFTQNIRMYDIVNKVKNI